MYTYVYIYVVCAYKYIYIHMYTHTDLYTCMHACMHIAIYDVHISLIHIYVVPQVVGKAGMIAQYNQSFTCNYQLNGGAQHYLKQTNLAG